MNFDFDFVLYASVSRGTVVLAEFINPSSGDADLETLASQCLSRYPQLHLKFSHTIRKRIYSFLIDDPFVFFAIIDEGLGKSASFQLLECVRDAFTKVLKSNSLKSVEEFENLSCYCFQDELEPIFAGLIVKSCKKMRSLQSLGEAFSSDDCRKNGVLMDLNSNSSPSGGLVSKKKKKRRGVEEMVVPMMVKSEGNPRETPIENRVDVKDGEEGSREFGVSVQKINGSSSMGLNAKKMWRRHVWTVLVLDLVVCFALFGVWLWVCKGFQCLAN